MEVLTQVKYSREKAEGRGQKFGAYGLPPAYVRLSAHVEACPLPSNGRLNRTQIKLLCRCI